MRATTRTVKARTQERASRSHSSRVSFNSAQTFTVAVIRNLINRSPDFFEKGNGEEPLRIKRRKEFRADRGDRDRELVSDFFPSQDRNSSSHCSRPDTGRPVGRNGGRRLWQRSEAEETRGRRNKKARQVRRRQCRVI